MKFVNLKASNFLLGELEHPNKMPFFGILTYFDAPSDRAPHGSDGRKVFIPSDVGVPALDSLVGMAVNLKKGMDDHDPQNKIGVITSACPGEPNEFGTPVMIEGFIYANDFPDAALDIKQNQSALGFSYETANTLLMDGMYEGELVAVVTQIVFTGASILYADDAAYTATFIAASAETETNNEEEVDQTMNPEQLEQLLAAINGLKEYVDAKFENFKKEDELEDQVADAIEDAQESLEDSTEIAASSTEKTTEEVTDEVEETNETQETEIDAAADLKAELDRVKAELAEIKASADLQAAARKTFTYPKTLISKYELPEEEEETKLMAAIDAREDLSLEERWALKIEARDKKLKQSK
jgi:hypothetical protein